jgi:hypothetical protein
MAYMSQETKKAIAAELKKVMPKGWKYSVAVRDHSTIALTIASAPVDLIALVSANRQNPVRDGYVQLNHYYLADEFKGDAEMIALFEKIYATLKGPDFFDNSDSQRDHFDVSHYIRINIGKWDKPFQKV